MADEDTSHDEIIALKKLIILIHVIYKNFLIVNNINKIIKLYFIGHLIVE